jgi:hypothetical protein
LRQIDIESKKGLLVLEIYSSLGVDDDDRLAAGINVDEIADWVHVEKRELVEPEPLPFSQFEYVDQVTTRARLEVAWTREVPGYV